MTGYDVAALVAALVLIAISVGWVALTSATCSAFLAREPVDLDEELAHLRHPTSDERYADWVPPKFRP